MKKNSDVINHTGIVREVTPNEIKVEIVNRSMCAACHAKSFCSLSDMSVKTISIYPPFSEQFTPGEEVAVIMKRSLGFRAVWISYVIPLTILLILLLSLSGLGLGELGAGLVSILAVGLYYVIIYLCRNRIARDFTFSIRNNN